MALQWHCSARAVQHVAVQHEPRVGGGAGAGAGAGASQQAVGHPPGQCVAGPGGGSSDGSCRAGGTVAWQWQAQGVTSTESGGGRLS